VFVFGGGGGLGGFWGGLGPFGELGGGDAGGGGNVGGAEEGGGVGGEVVFRGVGVSVGEFFYAGVLGHCGRVRAKSGGVLVMVIVFVDEFLVRWKFEVQLLCIKDFYATCLLLRI